MPQLSDQPSDPHPVLVDVVRSGFVEGRHRGVVVALDAHEQVAWSLGPAGETMLPRSCNKPLQLMGMLHAGLAGADLPDELVALGCASHSGEEFQVRGVRDLLDRAGLTEDALQTPPALPSSERARDAVLRAGGGPAPICMDCSGKHASMLLTCVVAGWPTKTYLEPTHPLQQAIRVTYEDMTGEPVQVVAVDGCGAPLFSATTAGLARAFSRLARGVDGKGAADPQARRVAEAIRAHPAWVSGTERDESALLRSVPGAIGKGGAEGCYAVALPDGRAFACKVDDGAGRARPVVMGAALARSGVLDEPGVDADGVRAASAAPLLGGAQQVGELRPTF